MLQLHNVPHNKAKKTNPIRKITYNVLNNHKSFRSEDTTSSNPMNPTTNKICWTSFYNLGRFYRTLIINFEHFDSALLYKSGPQRFTCDASQLSIFFVNLVQYIYIYKKRKIVRLSGFLALCNIEVCLEFIIHTDDRTMIIHFERG